MAVRLLKNQKVQLAKIAENQLRCLSCGMKWKPNKDGETLDLDQSLIVLDENGGYVKQVSYRKKEKSGEFYYHGDDVTGGSGGDSDDKRIDITFSALNSQCDRIIVVVNIFQAFSKMQDLCMVKDAYIHLWDIDSRKDLVEYQIENLPKFENKTGIIVGEFYKQEQGWEFRIIGEPVRVKDISEMIDIVQGKYASLLNRKKSWEEFLSQINSTPQYTSNSSSSRRGIFKLFGK